MSRASRPPPDPRAGLREVIFEFSRVGAQTKVCAVDPATGTEAVAFGPASASQADLERLALNKLLYVMGAKKKPAGDDGPGRLV